MKRMAALLVVVSLLASSCSFYTCPTYAKKTPTAPVKTKRI